MWNTIKTNKKRVILAIIIIAIVFFVYESLSSKKTALPQLSPFPTPASISEIPTDEKMVVSGISVNNVYRKELNTNTRGDVLFGENKDYQILYFSKEKQFLISITGSPFSQKRELAEQYFLKTLGISQQEACQLKTIINTPSFANPAQSGTNYKLSFCGK